MCGFPPPLLSVQERDDCSSLILRGLQLTHVTMVEDDWRFGVLMLPFLPFPSHAGKADVSAVSSMGESVEPQPQI